MDVDGNVLPHTVVPLNNFLTYRLAKAQAKLNAQASRILRDHAGITITQWRIIAVLGDTGRCTSAQLSRLTAMDKGLISRNVKTLAADGMITITRDASDNRALHLDLTDRGRATFDHTIPRMRDRQRDLRAYLDDAEFTTLMRACEKLEKAAEDPAI
ncbi:MarR family winged helix-turn-helix transcriptional regulator [Antarctobacter sp.]|uniref:MarR family winged helix-turn-helix transcriptional regulator n=1 Tax=Antarctobacter sp. TaxID=1872577 RepID=UPI002B265681|nr:MarR family winged helix-turn-helix transcriptional regulator [Antarctobacter sp.]